MHNLPVVDLRGTTSNGRVGEERGRGGGSGEGRRCSFNGFR